MTAFKVRLRVPSAVSSSAASDDTSTEKKPSTVDTTADVSMQSDSQAMSSEDELADEPLATPSTPSAGAGAEIKEDTSGKSSPSTDASKPKRAKPRRMGPPAGSISAVAATLTLEELDALPSAKRRKGLKTRGAPGPGRGWRKGLSKGQKPVYRLPGSDISTADLPQNQSVQPTTPVSFVKNSETSMTTKRAKSTSSPAPAPAASTSSSSRSSSSKVTENAVDQAFLYPSIPSLKEMPTILPLARVPNFIPAVASFEKPSVHLTVRPWHHRSREIQSIGGRVWRAPVWLSEKKQDTEAEAEAETDLAKDDTADDTASVDTAVTTAA